LGVSPREAFTYGRRQAFKVRDEMRKRAASKEATAS